MAGKDYDGRGCCGAVSFAVLLLFVGGLTALGWWIS
jgi:hypothetical protein